jgi:predicted Zn-dependent peptidase
MCLCVEGDVDPEQVSRIAREILGSERASVPQPDFGEPEDGLLPAEAMRREAMAVSAPQFLIGAKFESEKEGEALLRQRLVSQLALRLLVGASSPFYTRLYAEGLLNRDFDYESDFISGTASLFIGGESEEPEKVYEALREEAARVAAEGFGDERFERAKRASLGARLRGLEDFSSVCVSLASGVFENYCSLDAIAMLDKVTKRECEDFVRDAFAPERLAISIIEPKKD